MRESCSEGVAIHADPESCGGDRKGAVEALTGARAGRVLSREIHVSHRGADAVEVGGRQHREHREREVRPDPARSETPSTYGSLLHGNREIPALTRAAPAGLARIGNPKGARR
jgi:hypothetical protein